DFFTEGLWAQLPPRWQRALGTATPQQLAKLLGCQGGPGEGGVWPLSLLAFVAATHALACPRGGQLGGSAPPCQSPFLHPLLRRHVKPKKQHEIQRLGKVGASPQHWPGHGHSSQNGHGYSICMGTALSRGTVPSMGMGTAPSPSSHLPPSPPRRRRRPQSPLTARPPLHLAGRLDPAAPWGEFLLPASPGAGSGSAPRPRNPLTPLGGGAGGRQRLLVTGLHSCGDLSPALLRHFAGSPWVCAVVSVGCCYMKLSTASRRALPGLPPPGYPLSASVSALPGHHLSYRALEGACHALEEYRERLTRGGERLRVHCYRAALERLIREALPSSRRPALPAARGAQGMPFPLYARLGLPQVGLDPGSIPLETEEVEAMLGQQHRVVAFFSLTLLLAPLVETLILLDRLLYLREQAGLQCALVPLFDPRFSPRNLVLVAARTALGKVLAGLEGARGEEEKKMVRGEPAEEGER
ncbi:RRNAD protein, partial [Psilopogon haemacephalus]|nr:RRNAD protein [Psilopogon haemacephalus]